MFNLQSFFHRLAHELVRHAVLDAGVGPVFRHVGEHLRHINADDRDRLRLRLAAAGAGEGLHTGLGFRRLLRHFAVVPCVTERIHVSVHIAVAAGAGVGRVALGRTGWSGHNSLVAVFVRELRDGFGLRLAATGAGEGLYTGLGFRRLLRHFAFIPCVAERVRVSVHITVAAGAGVRRVALGRASRRGHNSSVTVLVRGRPVAAEIRRAI